MTALSFATVFQDHAVLQREMPIPVWGTGAPGSTVQVALGPHRARTACDARGCWKLRLPPLPAGGPHRLVVTDGDREVALEDILIGEVWLCSGQSNMQWGLHQCGADRIGDAPMDHPRIRLLSVTTPARLGRNDQVDGRWKVATTEAMLSFSAVGGWFGRRLHAELDVPIGLINNAWGGTRVQAWMSREAMMQDVDGRNEIMHYESVIHQADSDAPTDMESYEKRFIPEDSGNRGQAEGWSSRDFDDSAWGTMPVPSQWQSHGHPGHGVFWFRKTVTVPAAWAGRDLHLALGAVDKHDDSYVNGTRVGGLSWDHGPDSWCTARHYTVPATLVGEDGVVAISVRARSHAYQGGLIGPGHDMKLYPEGDEGSAIALAGDWRYHIEQDWGIVVIPPPPWGPDNPNTPSILFDNRVAPVLGYGIRGAIWYQGESNGDEGQRYKRQFPAMIRDWRRAWGQGDFPFHFVQLANYQAPVGEPGESHWALVREAQLETLSEPKTGMAVTIDAGEADDIHPKDKQTVGERLARLALAQDYGKAVVPNGPLFREAVIEAGGRIRCHFTHAAGLRTRDGLAPGHVAIAGVDHRFRWAETAIEGETLVAWHDEIPQPVAVRYAWAQNPDVANLVNAEDLPASPFRSDRW